METIVKGLTIGLELCEFTTSIVLVGQKVFKIFELDNLKALNLKYVYKRSFKENLSDLKKIKWFGTKKLGRFGSLKNCLNLHLIASVFRWIRRHQRGNLLDKESKIYLMDEIFLKEIFSKSIHYQRRQANV